MPYSGGQGSLSADATALPTFYVYWCPRCNVQTERSWHLCRRGPALIPQLDEETECVRLEVTPVTDGVLRGK